MHIWASTRYFSPYHIGEQQRLSCQSFHFLYTQSIVVDEGSDKKLDLALLDMSTWAFKRKEAFAQISSEVSWAGPYINP